MCSQFKDDTSVTGMLNAEFVKALQTVDLVKAQRKKQNKDELMGRHKVNPLISFPAHFSKPQILIVCFL